MLNVALLALFIILGPIYACAQHPALALLVAAVLGYCIRLERASGGRWRWLAVAGIAWAAFGIREWIAPGRPASWNDSPRLDLIAITPVLWITTAIALLRAGGALSPPWPVALRVLAVVLIVAPVLGTGLVAAIMGREVLYPWTDWSAPHAVLHVSNESDVVVLVSWQWDDAASGRRWVNVNGDGVVEARDGTIAQIMPILDDDAAQPIVLRVDPRTGDGRAIAGACVAEVDGHLRLRISSRGEVFISSGDQSWTGAPRFGAEAPLATN